MTGLDAQVLRLAADGLVAKEIAATLGMSESTVEYHLLCARRSLKARNTIEACVLFTKAQKITRKIVVDSQAGGEQISLLNGPEVA